jgi:hypothetical protein
MSYLMHAAVVNSSSLRQRITACAALEGISDPARWVNAAIYFIPNPDWTEAWAEAEQANPGGDHGADEAVITDPMILLGVKKERSRQDPQPWVQPSGAHDAYSKFFHVTHSGGVWRSTIDANVWEPGVSGWEAV